MPFKGSVPSVFSSLQIVFEMVVATRVQEPILFIHFLILCFPSIIWCRKAASFSLPSVLPQTFNVIISCLELEKLSLSLGKGRLSGSLNSYRIFEERFFISNSFSFPLSLPPVVNLFWIQGSDIGVNGYY